MTLTAIAARGNAAWWCVLVALCLALLAPLTIADVPPLLDYPNHLARLFVLANLPGDPVLARFYEPHRGIIPNLALDLTVPPLLRFFPVHDVGRSVIGLVLLLPVFGAAAYHRALSGRLSYWPLATALFAYNAALLRGFLNFIASVGLALLLAAAWVAWREQRPVLTLVTGVIGAIALFFCHLTGLLLLAVLIGGHELAWLRTSPFKYGEFARRAAIIIAIFAIPAVLYFISDLNHMTGDAEFRSVTEKAHAALSPVVNYCWLLDILTAVSCVATLVLCLVMRLCTIQFQAAVAIVALLVLFAGLPSAFKGTYDLDTRFIVMAAFVIPAALTPVVNLGNTRFLRSRRAIGAAFLLLFGLRMTVLMIAWGTWPAELAAFRNVIASVRPGDAVMTVDARRGAQPANWTSITAATSLEDGTAMDIHLPALLLIEHRAYWPFLFDNTSQQPIRTREPYRTAANLVDNSRDPIALLSNNEPAMRPFTHVLVLGQDAVHVSAGRLELVAANEVGALFVVLRDGISEARPRSPPPAR
jgi:hypothetical protein